MGFVEVWDDGLRRAKQSPWAGCQRHELNMVGLSVVNQSGRKIKGEGVTRGDNVNVVDPLWMPIHAHKE